MIRSVSISEFNKRRNPTAISENREQTQGNDIKANKSQSNGNDREILIRVLTEKYGTTRLNRKQLQTVLNVGESVAYRLLNDGTFPVRLNGRNKLVYVGDVADYILSE